MQSAHHTFTNAVVKKIDFVRQARSGATHEVLGAHSCNHLRVDARIASARIRVTHAQRLARHGEQLDQLAIFRRQLLHARPEDVVEHESTSHGLGIAERVRLCDVARQLEDEVRISRRLASDSFRCVLGALASSRQESESQAYRFLRPERLDLELDDRFARKIASARAARRDTRSSRDTRCDTPRATASAAALAGESTR